MASQSGNTAITVILAAIAGAGLLFLGFTAANSLSAEDPPVQAVEKAPDPAPAAPAAKPDPKIEVNLPDTINIGEQDKKKDK